MPVPVDAESRKQAILLMDKAVFEYSVRGQARLSHRGEGLVAAVAAAARLPVYVPILWIQASFTA
jgi:hypothetical protein